jgi:hypothetical protein
MRLGAARRGADLGSLAGLGSVASSDRGGSRETWIGRIVGAGIFEGGGHAFLLDLVAPQCGASAVSVTAPTTGLLAAAPEPPTFVLLGTAGIAIRCFLPILRLLRRRKNQPPEPPRSTAAP